MSEIKRLKYKWAFNRLREKALLKDDIFWQYFATYFDKQKRDNPC